MNKNPISKATPGFLGLSYMSCKMLEPKGSAAFLKLTFYTILKFVSHDVWNEDINKLIR